MKIAAVVNSKALPAEIVLDAVAENKVLGTMFGTNDQLSRTVKNMQNGDVGPMNEEEGTVPGVFQCSLCKKLCKDYRGMRIHQALAHKVKKQKYRK